MAKIKSVVLNKTEITDRHYIVEFYNPWWGRFAIDFKYDNASHTEHNMLNIMRVGDYFMVNGKPSNAEVNDVSEFSVVRYMRHETEAARKSGRELIIPNMSVHEMDNLADDILTRLAYVPYQTELNQIYNIIKDKFYITNLSPNMRLFDDLQFDSLDVGDLLTFVEIELNLPVYSLDFSKKASPYMTVGGLAKRARRISQRSQQTPIVKQYLVEKIKNLSDILKQRSREITK